MPLPVPVSMAESRRFLKTYPTVFLENQVNAFEQEETLSPYELKWLGSLKDELMRLAMGKV